MVKTLLVLCAAYLIGSVPVAYLLAKVFYGRDIRRIGSRNVGAMNVARNISLGLGLLTVSLDIFKGVLALILAKYWAGTVFALVLAPVLVIAGDIWPVFLGFRGGKGLAAAAGALLVIDLGIVFWAALVLGVAALITQNATAATVVTCLLLPLISWWQLGGFAWFFFGVIVALPILARHLKLSGTISYSNFLNQSF
jgi:glycerol-3-phosphate acyltransferase PlsY